MNIDINKIKNIEKEKKKAKAFSESLLLSSFISLINNVIEMGSKMNVSEMAMFIDSMQSWINNRGKKKSSKKCSPGTIVEVDFGLSYKTETPYRHSALVIKEYQNKVLIVPSTSRKDFLKVAYHPIDNIDGDKIFRKVGKDDCFDHDCVLILNDFKIVSKNRIMSTCGIIDTTSENCLYKEIRNTIMNDVFSDEVSMYESQISKLECTINSYKETVYKKKSIIDALYKKIELLEESVKPHSKFRKYSKREKRY